MVRELTQNDWPDVKEIYLAGLATGNASFETSAPEWETWDNSHLKHSRLVAEVNAEIAGWAALSPVSGRCVYGGVAEVSVYVSGAARGKGIGATLLNALIANSELNGIWSLQSGILQENEASIRLHEKCGFRTIGYREKPGQLNGVWRNVILMERRSKLI
ncbi:GNAT family N-acetyltransferase [Paradesertivirga mongoliensis]|uniref:GNAT family N-acetyltransferase n=1 Tax=Paradesertivirga mongoliensis TaxID=2100740 RepID=A0ABW4ZRU0_9SPHI|nr:GNAT family N-acetyltransferase [Pedobacter mongoliensis]